MGLFWADGIYSGLRGTDSKLCGLYWGALEHVDRLHFELAYHTPLEWVLTNNITVIDVGAQGEHKHARGFVPVQTQSLHWLAHTGFADAVEKFLERERAVQRGPRPSNQSCGEPSI